MPSHPHLKQTLEQICTLKEGDAKRCLSFLQFLETKNPAEDKNDQLMNEQITAFISYLELMVNSGIYPIEVPGHHRHIFLSSLSVANPEMEILINLLLTFVRIEQED